jgi:hypothetical protein
VFNRSIVSLLFLAAIASWGVAKEKVKQGVDLTGMKVGVDGRYAYAEEADFTKYTTMYVSRFLVSNKKKKYAGTTAEVGEEALMTSICSKCQGMVGLRLACHSRSRPSKNPYLLLEGRIVEFKPGSVGKRFWIGMGAGKGAAAVFAELKDGETGEILLKYFNRTLDTGDVTIRKNERVIEVLMRRQGKHLCSMINEAINGELEPAETLP